ncbi:hypothetical protein KHP62_17735 [Rhodobacteraceae bacterium NNCM2]|nr:hypothetical protein [Coraliihabitans acroporae]
MDAHTPLGHLLLVAYLVTAFGVMQAIALGQRHFSDNRGALRVIGAVVLFAALCFAGLMLLGGAGGWGVRAATILTFGLLLAALLMLAVYAPSRRFGPVSSAIMIAAGTVVLKSAFLWD